MSAADILERLRRDGVRVRADGDKVLLGPRERLTAEVLELVRLHKTEIIEALSGDAEREERRRQVVATLLADPALRYAYDVEGASPAGHPSRPVSVMLGLCDSSGTIVTGELTVPAEKWDIAAFITYWNQQAGGKSS